MDECMLPLPFSKSEPLDSSIERCESPVPHMVSTRRWEKYDRTFRCAWMRIERVALLYRQYISACVSLESIFEECIMYNVDLYDVSLYNCHVHFSEARRAKLVRCMFTDCVITTSAYALAEISYDTIFSNCTIRGNFVHPFKSDLQRVAEDPGKVQLPPYDVYNHISLHDIAIRKLREWACQHRWLQALRTGTEEEAARIWKTKPSGKDPFVVSELYDVDEQLETATRRA